MNRALPVAALCVSLLALAFALVPRGEVVAPPMALAPEPALSDDEAEFLKRRVELLEDDNRALWDRVVQLERRSPTAPGVAAAPAGLAAEVEKLRSELRSVMSGEVLTDEAGRGAIKELLREVQSDQQRERAQQVEERRREQAVQQQQRWKDFAGTAKLSYAAEQKLNERLELETAERTRKMEQLRLGQATWQEVSEFLRTQRRETDSAMGALLDESQTQQYQQLRRSDGRTGGGESLGARGAEGGRQGGRGGQRQAP